jgi:ubiquinone/menaquinone biosynthesis C-methylase UbiE/DNA-binding transcriptional ArsR family regulator
MNATPLFDRLAAVADPLRARILLAVEPRELSVSELRAVLQLPQSTVSRHLKTLTDAGWLSARENGTSNHYRLDLRSLDASGRRVWQSVREATEALPAARQDAERVHAVLAERPTRSQAFFASAGSQWDKMRSELFGARAELFALAGLLEPGHTVADLGCGTGTLAEVVAPFVQELIAVDESAAMLKAARSRLAPFRNVDTRRGTLEALPIDDASIDVAFINLVMAYVEEPTVALCEARRVLRPRTGRVVVVDMLPHDRREFQQTMGHRRAGVAPEELAAWAVAAGFATVRQHAVPPAPQAKGPTLFVAVLSV